MVGAFFGAGCVLFVEMITMLQWVSSLWNVAAYLGAGDGSNCVLGAGLPLGYFLCSGCVPYKLRLPR